MLSFLRLNFIPASIDLGLLILRLASAGAMLWLHGKGKLMDFNKAVEKFPVILGSAKVSLGMAIFAEVLCAGLLILGLFGRFAALALAVTMGVAFVMVHKMALTGTGSGEMAFLYLIPFVTLFFTGPGKFSVDGGAGGK
jgi:putative oxidoreductase